ncbi:MAG: hypothetical protein ACI8Z9_001948 [Paraglaciecola sp.]|jgi:uncharacterized protein (TIGR03643 family)
MGFAYVMSMKKTYPSFNPIDTSRIIEMAWEDRTPLEAVQRLFNINPNQLVQFMRNELKAGSFKVWRKRMNGRQTKHLALRPEGIIRAYCKTQYKHRSGK